MSESYEVDHLLRAHQAYMSGLQHDLRTGERQLRKEAKRMDNALRRGLRKSRRTENRPSTGTRIIALLRFLLS